jgi:hypothetical protein
MQEQQSNMKNFFKKFWWYLMIPIGLFFLSYVLRKDTSQLKKQIVSKKEEIKKKEAIVEKEKEEFKKFEGDLVKAKETTQKTLDHNLEKKNERDEKAKDYFPNS